MPVLRSLATDLDKDGSLKINIFGLVIEVSKGHNGHRQSVTRVLQWNQIGGLTIHRANALIKELRAELELLPMEDEEDESE